MDSNKTLPALLSNEVIEKAKQLNSTTIADALRNNGVMDYKIKSVTNNAKVVGTALTVSLHSGDNLFLHEAIHKAKQGYVLVVDGGGHVENAYLGELMAFSARAMGVEGIIIDGLVRDKEILKTLDLPIYAKGFIPSGPLKNGPGEINKPISCGGVSVEPGDLIVGDEDGVVVVRKEEIDRVLTAAENKLTYEQERLKQIQAFENSNDSSISIKPSWLDEKIKSNS
ncbi:RraA family protein [Ornithinibacillus sp. 4-3]|uniref:Putative 4-hydroxy-4-methyl-2-oxoglutarate aldolase n=1 Tax=Ornithinibacillus sp. 4-3 TaxID=3231488 RepID=A0AB39HQG0_9BACI